MHPLWKFLGLSILLTLVQVNNSASTQDDARPKDFEFIIIYNLTVIPNFQKSTFDGLLLLNITPSRNVSEIILSKENYSVDVAISGVNHTDLKVDQTNETLSLSKPFLKGKEYVMTMSFKNLKIRDDMTGFYKTQISKSEWAYLTNFYPNHARKVFPCIDDPSIRSTFILNINLTTESYDQVFANSEQNESNKKIFTFNSIGNISVHNFAFVILKNFISTHSYEKFYEKLPLYTRSEMINFTTFAINRFPIIMDDLSSTFAFYYPLDKLDVIAVPDYVPQENSNIGLMILPESSLLYDMENPSFVEELTILKSITRACASQWLQNIITPMTWDEAWVGESLVRYYEYFGFHTSNVIDQLTDQFLIEVRQKTMLAESLGFYDVTIKIDRAASIFRMLETFVGTSNFTKSIRTYVESTVNQSSSFDDLLKVFEDQTFLSNWLERTGYPVLNVNFLPEYIALSADTFCLYSESCIQDQSWIVPFELLDIYSFSNERFKLQLDKNILILSFVPKETFTIVSREGVLGYYRVNYDTQTWQKIIDILNSKDYDKIGAIDRSAILDDMFNLAKTGSLDYKIVFEGLKYLKHETEYLPMKTAINGLTNLLKVYETNRTDGHYKILLSWIQGIISPIFSNLSTIENENILFAREIIDFACSIGDSNCIKYVTTSFERFISNGIGVSGDLRLVVYCNALKFENENVEEKHYFDEMLDKLKQISFPNEKLDILMALGCYHNFVKLTWFLKESMSSFEKSEIYKAELVKVIENIYSTSLDKSEQMLLYLKNNYEKFKSYFGGTREIMDMISKIGRLHQSEKIAKILSNFKNIVEADDISQLMQGTIEKIGREMQASNLIIRKLVKVLDDPNIISTTSSPITTSSTSTTTTTEPTTTSPATLSTSTTTTPPTTLSTSTTTTAEPTTTPAPPPTSIGITLLKVIFGIAICVIIVLFGYFIFVKYIKGSYKSIRNRSTSDDGSIVMYDNAIV